MGIKSESTRFTRVGSPWVGLKMSESNPTHFMVNQEFYNPTQPTTSWWVKWIGSPTHIKKIIYVFIFKYSNI